MKNVKTEIIMQATAKLQDEIKDELEKEDPDIQEALAILEDNLMDGEKE